MRESVVDSIINDLYLGVFMEVLVTVPSVRDFIKEFRREYLCDAPRETRVDCNSISHGDTYIRVYSPSMGLEGLRGSRHHKHYSTVELSEDWWSFIKSRESTYSKRDKYSRSKYPKMVSSK